MMFKFIAEQLFLASSCFQLAECVFVSVHCRKHFPLSLFVDHHEGSKLLGKSLWKSSGKSESHCCTQTNKIIFKYSELLSFLKSKTKIEQLFVSIQTMRQKHVISLVLFTRNFLKCRNKMQRINSVTVSQCLYI